MRRSWSVLVLAVLAVSAASLRAEAPPADKTATDFALKGLDDKEVKLSDLKGKVVYLEFFATWCGFSRRSLPHTQTLTDGERAKDGDLVVLGITMGEDKEKVQGLLDESDYTIPVLLDDGSVGGDYDVKRVPTHVVIGRDGKIAWRGVGYDEAMGKAIDQAIETALDQPDAPRDAGPEAPKEEPAPPAEPPAEDKPAATAA